MTNNSVSPSNYGWLFLVKLSERFIQQDPTENSGHLWVTLSQHQMVIEILNAAKCPRIWQHSKLQISVTGKIFRELEPWNFLLKKKGKLSYYVGLRARYFLKYFYHSKYTGYQILKDNLLKIFASIFKWLFPIERETWVNELPLIRPVHHLGS